MLGLVFFPSFCIYVFLFPGMHVTCLPPSFHPSFFSSPAQIRCHRMHWHFPRMHALVVAIHDRPSVLLFQSIQKQGLYPCFLAQIKVQLYLPTYIGIYIWVLVASYIYILFIYIFIYTDSYGTFGYANSQSKKKNKIKMKMRKNKGWWLVQNKVYVRILLPFLGVGGNWSHAQTGVSFWYPTIIYSTCVTNSTSPPLFPFFFFFF